jgi:hypothetical protein
VKNERNRIFEVLYQEPGDRPGWNRGFKCPTHALTSVKFNDHPEHREDVLDVQRCLGDDSCPVCIKVCPFISGRQVQNNKKP